MKCLTTCCDSLKAFLKSCLQCSPCLYRFCRSSEKEYRYIKGLFGIIFGASVGTALYYGILVEIEHIPKAYQYHVRGVVVAAFALACAFSASVRCIFVLVIPNFFGKNGRNTVTTFAIMYLMTGPAANIMSNAEESARAISCTASLSFNHSREMFQLMHKPLVGAFREMERNNHEVEGITRSLRTNFNHLGREVRPKNLPPLPKTKKPRNKKVYTPRARKIQVDFERRVRGKCDGYKSSCSKFSPNIDPELGQTYVNIENLIDQFDRNYKIETKWQMMTFPLDVTSAENIQKAVLKEFNRKKVFFMAFFFIAQVMFSFTFVLVFVSAFQYNRKYLSDFNFDNSYLTSYFRRIDDRRKKQGKKTLLPLMKSEKKEYIEPFQFKMRKDEKSKCIKTGLRLIVQLLGTIAIVCFDKLLYEMLDIIRRHSKLDVVIKECLPVPTKSDPTIVRNIFLIWACVFTMVYFEAFTLRLRRTICAFFHRKREKKRVLFMYNDCLKKRKGFLKYMRQRVKRQAREDKLSRETGILTVLRRRFPRFCGCLKWCKLGRQSCLICSELETKKFHHCTGPGCYFSYCADCWKDVNRRCYACYTGKDDLDEDSSGTDVDELF
ncbi:E3 ubiquitin-protein ligase DCST1-like [Anneissia japonica]|uniref:E3 ubiquitin-protein ligase DCST1-like n=1 Tax=Anneissia japonica TaxID=1529436 RepID=UPI00142556E6|nr:E3 ubiquitin-protein ligase DCST1-like [Anneissia japonica]